MTALIDTNRFWILILFYLLSIIPPSAVYGLFFWIVRKMNRKINEYIEAPLTLKRQKRLVIFLAVLIFLSSTVFVISWTILHKRLLDIIMISAHSAIAVVYALSAKPNRKIYSFLMGKRYYRLDGPFGLYDE